MKKRLRKKLHKGEFRELGFEIRFEFDRLFTEKEVFDYCDGFIDMLESYGLEVGGGWDTKHFDGFITTHKGSVSPEEREKVIAWLSEAEDVKTFMTGELRDAWYGW